MSGPSSARRATALAGALGALQLAGCCVFSSPPWRGPVTDHFDGERFHNQGHVQQRELGDLVQWFLTRRPTPWPDRIDSQPGPPPPRLVGAGEMRVTFVGHATLLVQMDGLNILTDPIWSERAGPLSWTGPRRARAPGIRFEDLPPIHAVLLSHNHYDHFDMSTLVRLAREHDPTFVTGLGNAALLEAEGIARVVELDWWECEPLAAGVCVTAVPAQHFSMRGACDRDATLWAGFVVEGTAGAAYFAGDTGFGPHFAQIRERFGPVRLALLPIGAYLPRWIMAPVHMSPEEAVRAHGVLGASTSVGMHFGTFRQTDEGIDEPMHDLARAVGAAGEPRPRFWVLGFGQGRAVPGVGAPESAVGSWLR